MKVHHLAVTAILLGTGWTTNVVYEYSQNHQQRARVIASQDNEVTRENVSTRIQETEALAKELVDKMAGVKAVYEDEKSTLGDLIKVREENEDSVHELYRTFLDDKTTYGNFFNSNTENDLTSEIGKRYGTAVRSVEDLKVSYLMSDLNQKIQKLAEKRTAEQEVVLNQISANICEQNRELSSLTSSIKELLKDKEDVVEEVEEREDTSVADTLAMFQAFSMPYQMSPSAFFAQSQPVGLQSEQNPLGLDMNFLMMTNMLANTNGFGPRASINYSPVYNQQRTYYGMPSFNHVGRDNMMNNTTLMPEEMNTNDNFLRGIRAGFSSPTEPIFDRGNGLQGAFNFQ